MKRKILIKIGAIALCIIALVTFFTVGVFADDTTTKTQNNGVYYTEWDYYQIDRSGQNNCYNYVSNDGTTYRGMRVFVIIGYKGTSAVNLALSLHEDSVINSATFTSTTTSINASDEFSYQVVEFQIGLVTRTYSFDYIKITWNGGLVLPSDTTFKVFGFIAGTYSNSNYYKSAKNYADYRCAMYRDCGENQSVYQTPEASGTVIIDGYEDGYNKGYDDGYQIGEREGFDDGYLFGHDKGYEVGKTDGIEIGKTEGYTEGYNVGKSDGYTEGYTNGRSDGILSGTEGGYTNGYKDGYNKGYDDGYGSAEEFEYQQGYNDGYNDGLENEFGLEDLPFSVVDSITNVFRGMLDFEILGINIMSLFIDIIAVLLIIFVVKRLI